MIRSELVSRMHRAGLRLDDADLAARVALRCIIRERNELIARVVVTAGLSLRTVGKALGMSHEAIRKAVSTVDVGRLTANQGTMQPPEKGRASPCPPSQKSEPGSN